jgi:hypothetical protein
MSLRLVLARNANGRPTCQHLLAEGSHDMTACGWDIRHWSRIFTDGIIPVLLCKRCATIAGEAEIERARTRTRYHLRSVS